MLRPVAILLSAAALSGGALAAPAAGVPLAAPDPVSDAAPTVLINEIANGDGDSDSNSFFELRNWGDDAVALDGWRVYRCSIQGLRRNEGQHEADLDGVVLAPGQIHTISRVGLPGDDHVTSPLEHAGTGLWLEDADGRRVDAVGLYPNEPWPTESECTPESGNLPNALDFAQDESWQRVAATGDVAVDFVAAPSTIGAPNATRAAPTADSAVVVSELAGAGPAGRGDDFVELTNTGARTEDLGGWRVYRCTKHGYLRPDSLQLTIAEGTRLAPGARFVVGGPGFTGDADATAATGLANVGFGVLIRDDAGAVVDRIAVSPYRDSPCQGPGSGPGAKLAAVLDTASGESWQRTDDGFVIAPRTPGGRNATEQRSVFLEDFAYPAEPGVAISEVATDPPTDGMPDGTERRNYIELANYGAQTVDIGGWELRRCQADGARAADPQLVVPAGTRLAPGRTYLAARTGTPAAADADATYDVALSFLGAGVWVADADGARVDSVGVYSRNEMDRANVTLSPCTKGLALTTYQPDRLERETFQRVGFTGVDVDDFTTAPATPGELDRHGAVDATAFVAGAAPWAVTESARALGAPVAARPADAGPATAATVLEAWQGVADGPLAGIRGSGERRVDPEAGVPIADDGFGHPYQRLVLDARGFDAGSLVRWSGSTVGRNELQLSVWDARRSAWRALDAGAGPEVELAGTLAEGDLDDGRVTLLVQDGPRTAATLSTSRDGAFEDPDGYDLAISHLTDTQYLAESYPDVYARMVSWIAENAESRKIDFAVHTGDLVQNWVDPAQSEDRARLEFERASAIQAILDDAGIANSVLPGNHDNKRGITNDLYNEYFGPDRYTRMPGYGGSIAPGDNSASFSTFTSAGARFLVLSLPYAYGDRELGWAEEVVAAHPEHNVVVATHEHLTPKDRHVGTQRATANRWVSRADELWSRVIAPNRNVVLVLAGHYHGLGRIVTENAGGIEGHTVVELLADYQEFRTHTGERATGFQRLLQIDLAAGAIAVDTFSVLVEDAAAHPYDYRQFTPDSGQPNSFSNDRPWRIVEAGLQQRYTASDDEFQVRVSFQYPKSVATRGVSVAPPAAPDDVRADAPSGCAGRS